MSSEWVSCQLCREVALVDFEAFGQVLDVFVVGLRLSVKDCCDGDFVTPDVFGDVGEG